MMYPYLQVAAGAAIGGVCRFAVYRAVPVHWGGYGVATLLVNVAGSFVMGVLAALLALRLGNAWAPFLMTGDLGGFTTFSTAALDVTHLTRQGRWRAAALNALGMLVVCVLLAGAGVWLGAKL